MVAAASCSRDPFQKLCPKVVPQNLCPKVVPQKESNLRARLLEIDYFLSEKVLNLQQSWGSLAYWFFISDSKSREALAIDV